MLIPNSETVNGVFPGVGQGTRWYDWYTLKEVQAQPQQNMTMSAPLTYINVHVRGGSILALQQPQLTTAAVRKTPFSLLIALDDDDKAEGSVYLDDGVSLNPSSTRLVSVSFIS